MACKTTAAGVETASSEWDYRPCYQDCWHTAYWPINRLQALLWIERTSIC